MVPSSSCCNSVSKQEHGARSCWLPHVLTVFFSLGRRSAPLKTNLPFVRSLLVFSPQFAFLRECEESGLSGERLHELIDFRRLNQQHLARKFRTSPFTSTCHQLTAFDYCLRTPHLLICFSRTDSDHSPALFTSLASLRFTTNAFRPLPPSTKRESFRISN